MKRSAIKRDPEAVKAWQDRSRAPLVRSGPSLKVKRQGGTARARQARARAGIPEDGPRNAKGESCVKKTCEVCGEPFLAVRAQAFRRKTCSIKCAAESKRRKSAGKRRGAANPNYRHGRRAGKRDRVGEARWRAALKDACELHADCRRRDLLQHHVVYRQAIERAGGDVWDSRDSMTVCNPGHTSHHQRGKIIPLVLLPDVAYLFAAELLGAPRAYEYLRRRYGGDDPRLDALLDREYPQDAGTRLAGAGSGA